MALMDTTPPHRTIILGRLIWMTLFFCGLVGLNTASAAVLSVPSAYNTVAAAVSAAQDDDIIEIAEGTYSGSGIVATVNQNNLTIRGVGGFAHLNADGVTISNRKAIFVIGRHSDNITLENIEFSNASVPDANGAGIRHEGGLLTIRRCYFHDNQNGILTSAMADGELFIEHSEFDHNGLGDPGYTHNIYVGHIRKFTMQYSYSHHATHGHNVKSRAEENHLLYNRIMDETTGNASYQIDLPNGGRSFVIGNTLHQGVHGENSSMISYAAEGVGSNHPQELYVSGNTMVNDLSNGRAIRLANSPTAVIVNNIFDNIHADRVIIGSAAVDENNVVGVDNYFVDRERFNFRLTEGSPAANAGGSAGTYHGVDLRPVEEYVHPRDRKHRAVDGQLDAGAFEFGGGSDPVRPDPPSNLVVE